MSEQEYDPVLEEMLRRLAEIDSGQTEVIPDEVARPHAYQR